MRKTVSSLVTLLTLAVSGAASANALPPPPGAILDLGGGETDTAPQKNMGWVNGPTTESVSFIAGQSSSDIALAFRDDPGGLQIYNVQLINLTSPSGNILVNGDFSGGIHPSNLLWPSQPNPYTPDGWYYGSVQPFDSANAGVAVNPGDIAALEASRGISGSYTGCGDYIVNGGGGGVPYNFGGASPPVLPASCFADGLGGSYDFIVHPVTLDVGDTYTLSFEYTEREGDAQPSQLQQYFQDTSTCGGNCNGLDILAYAKGGTAVPEPATLALFGVGLAGLGFMRKRKLM